MAVRGIVFLLSGLLLGGCMQATLDPVSDASFTARDRKLLANPPYEKATILSPISVTSFNITARKRRARSWSIRRNAISTTSCPTGRRCAMA